MKSLRSVLGTMAFCAAMLAVGTPAKADVSYTGTIEVIEVWKLGNVAFRLNGASVSCASNNWMVINKGAAGAKNLYAALLASKLAGKAIRVSAYGCGPADDYGPTPYLVVDYLYMVD